MPDRTASKRKPSRSSAVRLPSKGVTPFRQVSVRLAVSVLVMLGVAFVVWLDRAGYRDGDEVGTLSFLDSVYYSTVSLSTTGYGDITAVSPGARLFNILIVTPLRILFLALLVGTTLEVLTERSRAALRENRWRQRMDAHTIVIGYGVKGRAAVGSLIESGTPLEDIVIVDTSPGAAADANDAGMAAIIGDATRSDVLLQAEITRARSVIVATNDDAQAALVTLTARKLNGSNVIVASVRDSENADLLTQSGANSVITSATTSGRILGLSANEPLLGQVVEDLLENSEGLELLARELTADEVGSAPRDLVQPVLAVLRDGVVLRYDQVAELELRDRVVVAAVVPAEKSAR